MKRVPRLALPLRLGGIRIGLRLQFIYQPYSLFCTQQADVQNLNQKENKKLIFEIDSKKKKKEKEISDCFCNNYIKQKKEENNFLINI